MVKTLSEKIVTAAFTGQDPEELEILSQIEGGTLVTSVQGQSGDVTLSASDVGALPDTYTAPVTSVNNQTGEVNLDASDINALPDTYAPGWDDVTDKPTEFPAALLGQPGGPVGPGVNTVQVVYANDASGQQTTFPFTEAATGETFAFRDSNGRLQVASGTATSDVVNVGQLNSRLSAAQRTAIDALTAIADPSTATAEDVANAVNAIISALQAT